MSEKDQTHLDAVIRMYENRVEALNKSHLKDTAFLIKLRAKERRKVWKLEKEIKQLKNQVSKK